MSLGKVLVSRRGAFSLGVEGFLFFLFFVCLVVVRSLGKVLGSGRGAFRSLKSFTWGALILVWSVLVLGAQRRRRAIHLQPKK